MRPLSRHTLRRRFQTACRVLDADRLHRLTIHHGRHSFVTVPSLAGGTWPEVRDAAGHTNLSVTSAYRHIEVDDDEEPGTLFG